MKENDDCTLLIIIVVGIIVFLFITQKNISHFQDEEAVTMDVMDRIASEPLYDPARMPLSSVKNCPVKSNEYDMINYAPQQPLYAPSKCPDHVKPQTAKQFHQDFFGFRDLTEQNSSMRYDAVDRINDLYLSGNTSPARGYPCKKIKDIYDGITGLPSQYSRQCVRVPKFDNINHEGYRISYGSTGTMLTRPHWNYKHEKIMNGGNISESLYPNDLEANPHLPVVNEEI